MSHFTVIVCIDDPEKLEAALAPFDENLEGVAEPKWDYWRIGGRWGGYFPFRPEYRDKVMLPERGWDSPGEVPPGHCDGGPKLALDLDELRTAKAAGARKTYREYQALTEGTPEPVPWSVFADNISEGNGYTVEQARDEYHAQPRWKVIAGTDFRYYDDAFATFGKPESLFVEHARAQAVPGYATLTTDGRWRAP